MARKRVLKKKPLGVKGHWEIKKVPATTNNKQQAIINFLLEQGHSASRVNVQGQWDQTLNDGAGGWRPSGSRVGFFDIVACLKGRDGRGLYFTWDQKTDDDVLSPEQIDYMNEVRASGGFAECGDGLEEFLPIYGAIKSYWL